jgi:NAD(P)-dependent dehydrogenase (short-subunit alcohol dehydrogenase family)
MNQTTIQSYNQSIFRDLDGKVAIITGGSSLIAAATADALVRNGVAVALAARNVENLQRVSGALAAKRGKAISIPVDVTDLASVESMRNEAETQLGPTDILITLAGGHGKPVSIDDLSLEAWRETLDVNLTGTFLTLKAFLPGMISRRHWFHRYSRLHSGTASFACFTSLRRSQSGCFNAHAADCYASGRIWGARQCDCSGRSG